MSTSSSVSLSLPDKVPAALGQSVTIKVGITDFSGRDRDVLVRLVGSLTGPLPAVTQTLRAHLSIQVNLPMLVPAGMPPGDHPVLIEVLDRSSGDVLGSGEVFLEVQRTRSVAMHLSPPSIRRRLRGKIRVVLRNHDDQTHFIRMRTESDDNDSRIKLLNDEIEIRAGEMVRIKGRLRVRPFFVGKQKEHWYSIIGEGAGAPIYSRGNIRHVPMIGRNVKSVMGLMCIVLVWAAATLAVVRAVSPVTKDATASASGENNQGTGTGTESGSGGTLELPVLVDVSGKVTAVPDGSGVVVKWRSVTIGDVEGSGKVSASTSTNNPNVANLSTTTDEKGAFSVAGLDASGLYEFSFSKAGHQTQTIIVQPKGEPVSLEIALEVGEGVISGITVDEFGKPLGGVNVTLSDGNITYQTTTPTEGDLLGKFSFANLSTPATWIIDAQIDGRGLSSTTVPLEAGSSQPDVTLALSPNVTTLSGNVTSTLFALGIIPVVTVTATDGITTRSTTSLTDRSQAGQFRLEQLPVGRTYTVTYVSEGFVTFTEIIDLSVTTNPREVTMTRSSGRLAGKVTVNSDIVSASSVAISISNNVNTYKSTNLVASDGQYVFTDIAPGHYIVTFEALGLDDRIYEVDIGAGTTSRVDAELNEVADTTRSSSLRFKVTKEGEDASENNPATVTVKVFHRASDDCGTVITGSIEDSDCEYQLDNDVAEPTSAVHIEKLDAGAYYLEFSAAGYSTKVVQTSLAQSEDKDRIDITLQALGTLSGQVTDDTGTPVVGVTINLIPKNGVTQTKTTDANGEYKFANSLDVTAYTIQTQNENFLPVTRGITGALSATVNVDIGVRGKSIVYGQVYSLDLATGIYTAVEAKNFYVYYRKTGDSAWIDASTVGVSKGLGSYRLGLVPTNSENPSYETCLVSPIDISVPFVVDKDACSSAADTSTNPPAMPANHNAKAFLNVIVPSGESVSRSAYFSLSPGVIQGKVTVGDVAQADVVVEAQRKTADGSVLETVSVKTDDQGQFVFSSLTPTSATVPSSPNNLNDPNYITNYLSCSYSSGSCWTISASLPLLVPASYSKLVSVFPRVTTKLDDVLDISKTKGAISLTITNSAGLAIRNLPVVLKNSADVQQGSVTTDEDGRVTFSDLDADTWTVSISPTNDYSGLEQIYNISQGLLVNETIRLNDLRGDLRIYLRDAAGPVAGVNVVEVFDDSTSTNKCDSSGTTTLTSNDGICTIPGVNSGIHTYLASKDGLTSATISVLIIGGQVNVANATLGSNSGSLLVTLRDITGSVIQGQRVFATDSQNELKSCATASTTDDPRPREDQLGSCEISGLNFGIASINTEASEDYGAVYGTISIGSGGSALTLTASPKKGVVTFNFFDANDNPIFGATASVTIDNQQKSCTALANENSCNIANIPQGISDIVSTKIGYAQSTLPISVFAGSNTAVRITLLASLSSLKGNVLEISQSCPATLTSCSGIPNALVTASNSSGLSALTVSDQNGAYNYGTSLVSGLWKVQASAYGYAPSASVNKTVSGANNDDVNLLLIPLNGSLELSLLSPVGGPVEGIQVRLSRSGLTINPKVSTETGQIVFNNSNLAYGTYSVAVVDTASPPRFVSQNFLVNIDRASAVRLAIYLGTYGSFVSVPVIGIPASAFGPEIPLEVDVALINADGEVAYASTTQDIGSQKIASFAGVSDGDYDIALATKSTIAPGTPIGISAVTTSSGLTTYTTTQPHGLSNGDYVRVIGLTPTQFNTNVAKVTVISSTQFSIARDRSSFTIVSNFSNASVSKIFDQSSWLTSSHDITAAGNTYVVPDSSSVSATDLPRTISLDPITLVIKPVDLNIKVQSGDTPAIVVPNAEVTLSDGFLLNPKNDETDVTGNAVFSAVPPGTYTVTIDSDQGFTSRQQITVSDYSSASGVQSFTLSLTAGTGNVAVSVGGDGTNSGLVGAVVTDVTSGKSCVTAGPGTTIGKCTLSDLSSGPHRFRVTHSGYDMVETSDVNVVGGRTVETSVSLGDTTGDVQITALDAFSGSLLTGITFAPSADGKSDCTNNPCTFTGLPLIQTNFVVTKSGYEDSYVAVDVTGGPLTHLSVSMVPSSTNTLNVVVIDSITGDEVVGVDITRDGSTVCNDQSDNKTDASGVCTGLNQAAGQFTLKATKSGYEDTYATASIISRRNAKVIISMRPTRTSFTLNILDGSRAFAGVAGAAITLPANSGSCAAVVGSAGEYNCSNIPLRALDIKVTKSGYLDSYISVTPTWSEVSENGATVVMTSSVTTEDLIVSVVNSVDGSPIAGINVNQCTAVTDADGECTRSSLPTGSYSLTATSPVTAAQQYESGFATVTVGPSGSASATISMRPITTSTKIVISDINGNLVSGASVTPSTGSCSTSDANGESTCTNMPTTSVTFTVTKNGYSTGFATMTPSLSKSSTNVGKIILTPTSSPGLLSVRLINAATGSLITDAITVTVPGETNCSTTSGTCTFSAVALGQITVTASSNNNIFEDNFANVSISPLGGTSATIAMRPKTNAITVNVYDTSGSVLIGAAVKYGSGWSSSCTGTGPFNCSGLTSSSIPIRVSKTGFISQYVSAYTGTGPISVVLVAEPTPPGSPGDLTVTVVDQANNAVTGASVSVTDSSNTDLTCTLVANVCTKTGLSVGQYLVSASKAGENGFATVSMTAEVTTSVKIVVRSISAAPTAADFTLSVLNSSGSGISSATITASSGSCSSADSSGNYTCTGLSLAPTSFKIEKTNYDTAYVNVTPTSSTGGHARVILATTPAVVATTNTLNVNVVDVSTGTPLSGVTVNQCSSTTNASGECSGTSLAVGPLSIVVSLANYETTYSTVSISSTGPTSLKVALRPVNAKISFNIYDSRTGALITASISIDAASAVSCVNNCSLSVSGQGNKSITITASGYRSATATVAYLGSPVSLNFYLIPVSTLTVNFPSVSIPSTTVAGFTTTVTVTLTGTSYTCSGTTSCTIGDLPYGFYNITTSANSGKTGSASVYSVTSTSTLS